ncbi:MAG: hydrogenase maturation protein [Alphaproteobacteria bacterium]|nr:hydrogenase maturation protein [Alphaproteobacteria bacterium]
MRVLLLTHAFNSLAQRLFVELRDMGHEVFVEFDVNDATTLEAVALCRPDLVIAPFLKRAIPEALWRERTCLVVHPGPEGDRGPSALDWAILEGRAEWGVTLLQAEAEMDAGPVWASARFPMREATKSSLYRHEIAEAAVQCVREALSGSPRPCRVPLAPMRPACRQADRAIDWTRDDTATVLRKIRSADGDPGLRDPLGHLFDASPAEGLGGEPGALLARSGDAVARATRDGAVWLGRVRGADGLKLPAAKALGAELPEIPGWRDLWYEEDGAVGYLHFPFHNGAMSTEQCERLLAAWRAALTRDTRVLVLMGGPDFWSNGIHLATIEAADSPADESWRNIQAMDDLAQAIIETTDRWVIAALGGNAGAGGVFLALAADAVWARDGVVLNPHYKGMGNLYGSEYWTYLLPRRCGPERAQRITQARLPVGTDEALALGLIDARLDRDGFEQAVRSGATELANDLDIGHRLYEKARGRREDEAEKPLAAYRAEELDRMKLNFYGFDPSYHVARHNFILRVPKSRTPSFLAPHRARLAIG